MPRSSWSYTRPCHTVWWKTGNTADLYFNNTQIVDDLRFGGRPVLKSDLSDGDQIESVLEPGGATHHQLLLIEGTNDAFEPLIGPAVFYGDNRTPNGRKGVEYVHSGADESNVVGLIASMTPDSGPMSVAFNELSAGDQDGDLVADDLEEQLNTCPNNYTTLSSGWDCGTYDASDTDGDGLSDHEEVFGVEHTEWVYSCSSYYFCTYLPVHDDLAFRYWGASPIHKDVYVEVDREETVSGSSGVFYPNDAELYQLLDPGYARDVAQMYLDGASDDILNPDLEDGIRLHFDIEGSPIVDYDSNYRALQFSTQYSGQIRDGEECGTTDSELVTQRENNLTDTRAQYFHHLCLHEDGSDRKAEIVGLTASASATYYSTAHELGHNLGLRHAGSQPNVLTGQPNYFSVMNYAFSRDPMDNYRPVGFSDGRRISLDPRDLCEQDGLGSGIDVGHLNKQSSAAPHQLDVHIQNGYVDWSRDAA